MKKLITILIFISLTYACGKSPTMPEYSGERVEINFTYNKRGGLWSNQFAAWVEDEHGNYINTIFATEKTTKGGLWKKRAEALMNWRKKIDISNMNSSEMDAFSGATPKAKRNRQKYSWNITDSNGIRVPDGKYIFYVEGTIYKDHYVLYKGEITVGGLAVTVTAAPFYSSEEAKTSDMIDNVYASYFQN